MASARANQHSLNMKKCVVCVLFHYVLTVFAHFGIKGISMLCICQTDNLKIQLQEQRVDGFYVKY